MSRLIDADKLLEKTQLLFDEDGDYVDAVPEEYIEEAPVVDAVPVVRCKDCKYWEWYGSGLTGSCLIETGPLHMFADDFCSDGEKSE